MGLPIRGGCARGAPSVQYIRSVGPSAHYSTPSEQSHALRTYPGPARIASSQIAAVAPRTARVVSHVATSSMTSPSMTVRTSSPRIVASSPLPKTRTGTPAVAREPITRGAAMMHLTGGPQGPKQRTSQDRPQSADPTRHVAIEAARPRSGPRLDLAEVPRSASGGESAPAASIRGRSAGVAGDRSPPGSLSQRSPRNTGRSSPPGGIRAGAKASATSSAVQSRSPSASPRVGGVTSSLRQSATRRSSSQEPDVRPRSTGATVGSARASRSNTPLSARSRSPSAASSPRGSLRGSQSWSSASAQSHAAGAGSARRASARRPEAKAHLRKPEQAAHQPEEPQAWCHWRGGASCDMGFASPRQDLRCCRSEQSAFDAGGVASSIPGGQVVEHGILSEQDTNSPTKRKHSNGIDEKLENKVREVPRQATPDENMPGLGQVSPSPSTVDMHVSSAPSLLSGGLELSDSGSCPSLTFSTNSSSKEDASSMQGMPQRRRSQGRRTPELVAREARSHAEQQGGTAHAPSGQRTPDKDENQPPAESMVPTPRTFQVTGQQAGDLDPLAQTVKKTVSTMRCFWEKKARLSAGGSKESQEVLKPRRSQSEHPRSRWIRKEIAWLQSHTEQQKEFCDQLFARVRGPGAPADLSSNESPESKSSNSFESDLSGGSASKTVEEDESMISTVKTWRQTASQLRKVNRKTMDLMLELLDRCPQQGRQGTTKGCQVLTQGLVS